MAKPAHYRGSYHVRSRRARATWYANPATTCAFCGLTLAEGVAAYGERGARWDADHTRPGDPTSPLRPSHATCNRSAGAAHGNRLRNAGPSSGWFRALD
jgi:hypothetical protein